MAVVLVYTSTLGRRANKTRSSGEPDRRCSTTQRFSVARLRSNRFFRTSYDGCPYVRHFPRAEAVQSLVCVDTSAIPNLTCHAQGRLLAATSGIGQYHSGLGFRCSDCSIL